MFGALIVGVERGSPSWMKYYLENIKLNRKVEKINEKKDFEKKKRRERDNVAAPSGVNADARE